jgi:VanZ family protein
MDAGGNPRPMGRLLAGFFLRLGLTLAVLYVSLKFLNGSVYALAAGLAMGIIALTFEGLRLVKMWTV